MRNGTPAKLVRARADFANCSRAFYQVGHQKFRQKRECKNVSLVFEGGTARDALAFWTTPDTSPAKESLLLSVPARRARPASHVRGERQPG
jgi:hypothetical protein